MESLSIETTFLYTPKFRDYYIMAIVKFAFDVPPNEVRTIKNPGLRKFTKKLVLYLSRLIIPKGATVNNTPVTQIYYSMWSNMLCPHQTLRSFFENIGAIITSSFIIFKNYYTYGDFEGICIKQRLLSFFRKGGI